MFSASNNKGFQLTFTNGNTVSVQFGPGNYCDPIHPEGRNAPFDAPMKERAWDANSAEVAAWNANGDWHNFGSDTVTGWQSADEVLEFLAFAASNELDTSSPFGDYDDDEDEEEDDATLVEDE